MCAAAAHLHNLHGVELTETIDIIVTCDGTWCKHGFTGTHWVVVVIAWETGKVLDFIIMTKRCSIYARKKTVLGEYSQEFADLWEGHKDSCEINHLGSSPAMECAGALEIWKRSEELHHLRYVEVICDGDAKTISTLNDHKPYGGHVLKRMGNMLEKEMVDFRRDKKMAKTKVKVLIDQLRELKVVEKEKMKAQIEREKTECLRKGRKGKGLVQLMKENTVVKALEKEISDIHVSDDELDIVLLKWYYGNHTRAHPNNLNAMQDACWSEFYHTVSTDQDPQHQYFPEGAESWCKYNKALALDQNVPPHSSTIPADLQQYVKPVFDDLCKGELLDKYLLGATQNRNECFNTLVWAHAPKTEYVTRHTIEDAVSHAFLVFNSGRQAIASVMERLCSKAGPLCISHLVSQDVYRTKRPQTRESEVAKRRRKSKQVVEKLVEAVRVEAEGTTYEAGGFE